MALKSDLVLPSDGIKIKLSNVKAFVGEKDYGSGTLCISESDLIWMLNDGKGLTFNYPQIALHAISSDLAAFPHECLYMIVDKNALDGSREEPENEDESSDNSDDSDEISPIRFVPEDKTFLQPMFRAINECQALHPDPEDDMSGDDDEDGENEGENEEGEENVDDDENDFRNDEDINDEAVQRIESGDLGGEFDPASVQLSARGRQIWERLNAANARNQSESNNGGEEKSSSAANQFQDADDISQQ